VDHTE